MPMGRRFALPWAAICKPVGLLSPSPLGKKLKNATQLEIQSTHLSECIKANAEQKARG